MKHGIERIFPALRDQPVLGLSRVFDKAVAVLVAIIGDPGERALDVRPHFGDEIAIAGSFVIGAGQDDEQRRGIDAAVVFTERDFTQGGHLATAHFVQDLARLGILLGNDFAGLVFGQVRKHRGPSRD